MDGHNFMLNKYSGELIGAKMIVNNDGGWKVHVQIC